MVVAVLCLCTRTAEWHSISWLTCLCKGAERLPRIGQLHIFLSNAVQSMCCRGAAAAHGHLRGLIHLCSCAMETFITVLK